MRCRINIRRWQFELELVLGKLQARIPLQVKLTFYICTVVLLCMIVLSAVCIVISLHSTQKLMSERLAHFAAIKAEQTERVLRNEVVVLDTTLQGDRITNTMQSIYFGNITSLKWAENMNSMVLDLYATTLRSIQIITFYDVRGNIIFSARNPDFSDGSARQLQPKLNSLFPLGYTINSTKNTNTTNDSGTNGTNFRNSSQNNYTNSSDRIPSKGASKSEGLLINQTIMCTNSTQIESYAAQAAVDAAENQDTMFGKVLTTQDDYRPPINFTEVSNGMTSWLTGPIPLFNSSGNITAYSYSLTTPMNQLQVSDSVQASTLIGYCTAVLDGSRYMNGTFTLDSTNGYTPDESEYSLSIIGTSNGLWKFLFPSDLDGLDKYYPLYTFPAVQANQDMWHKYKNKDPASKPGGALMKTQAPGISRASVGYSYVNAIGPEWIIMVSVPRSDVEQSYRHQTWKLLGVAAAMLVFVSLSALFLTGFIVHPLFHIYHGMELRPRHFNQKDLDPFLQDKSTVNGINISETSEASLATISNTMQMKGKGNQATEEIQSLEGTVISFSSVSGNFTNTTRSSEIANEIECSGPEFDEESEVFRVPGKIAPLNRWISDEFDELIEVYNCLVDMLVRQHAKVEDEVRLRTHEARESQRLAETANTAKSRFMMNISHELLTPMNGIMGITAVSLEEPNMLQVRAGLQIILKSGNVLQELLNELLTYAAHLAGVEQSFQNFTLKRLATSIEDTFTNRADAKGVDFKVQVCPKSFDNYQIECDFERIMHICTSLVSNAVKFSDTNKIKELAQNSNTSRESSGSPGSFCPSTDTSSCPTHRVWIQIYVRTPDSCVELPAEIPPGKCGMLVIVVSDNGVGIPKDKLAHIFEVFEQGEDALSKYFTGTGLGLAMSKLLCEGLGGCISVSSCQYVGSIVELRLPIYNISKPPLDSKSPPHPMAFEQHIPGRVIWRANTRNTELVQVNYRNCNRSKLTCSHRSQGSNSSHGSSGRESTIEKSEAASPRIDEYDGNQQALKNLRVLVVDDNELLRTLYQKMLQKIGVGVIEVASDGEEAIQLVENAIVKGTRYRIIFMDLEMPKKNGVETTEIIWRQLGYGSPVVALTGYSDSETITRCREMGLSKVLVKPVSLEQLDQTIRDLQAYELRNYNTPTKS